MTSLPSRARFEEKAQWQLEFINRHGTGGALLLLQLAGPGAPQDAGEEALQAAAAVLETRLRATDASGRLGDGEVGVFLPQIGPVDAAEMARGLVAAIRSAGGAAPEKAIVGVAYFRREHAPSWSDLLENAREAVGRAGSSHDGFALSEITAVRIPPDESGSTQPR
ncbi:MAG: diguanylate cyclase [Actinobacteria bacterium]|nr:diguanylate cyclase [Actinomycetota bacterium]